MVISRREPPRRAWGHAPMDRTGTGPGQLDRAHLVDLDGSGMLGLARVLVQRGCVVTGSVRRPGPSMDRLRRLGVRVHSGHGRGSPLRSARLLVYGPGVPTEDPERLRAARLGVEQASCPDVLARLIGRGVGIAAVGGRRAGSAAAMVAWTLAQAGLDPTLVLDASTPEVGGTGRLGTGPHVVIDAAGLPEDAVSGVPIVLVLDDGDAGYPRPLALRRRAEAAPPGGYVLGLADEGDDPAPRFGAAPGVDVERFSLGPGHDWWGADVREDRGCHRFRAFHRGRFVVEVRLQAPGRHHVVGALAAVAICERVGVASRVIKGALEEFAGVSRGFESRGSFRGVTLVDDEAPGPRCVGEALGVARQVYGRRRLVAAYRPGPDGLGSWATVAEFAAADLVVVVDEEGPTAGEGARALAEALSEDGSAATRAPGLDGAIRELDRLLEPGDVLVTLGTGDVGTIADAFLRRLSRDRHA